MLLSKIVSPPLFLHWLLSKLNNQRASSGHKYQSLGPVRSFYAITQKSFANIVGSLFSHAILPKECKAEVGTQSIVIS
jgi:hypothetical protein